MNQRIEAGRWHLLETITLAANDNWKVELSDQSPGEVVADAVAITPPLTRGADVGAVFIPFATGAGLGVRAVKATTEAHHLLPQAERFKKFFKRADLDIKDFKIPLDKAKHRLNPGGVHTNSAGNWNKIWDDFFQCNPNATRQENTGSDGADEARFRNLSNDVLRASSRPLAKVCGGSQPE